MEAVFGALEQDQLFRLLCPVGHLYPAGVRESRVGFAMYDQERTRRQLPRAACALGLWR